MKKYQVIMQDEYDNLYHLGFYKELKDDGGDTYVMVRGFIFENNE